MKKLFALLAAMALCLSLAACSEEQTSSTVNDVYAEAGGEITLPEGMDTSKRFNSQIDGSVLYAQFNNILVRNTGYFHTMGDTITLTSYATTESTGLLEYKAGLWRLTENDQAEYVEGCTLYFTTGGDCYTGTFSGLDPNERYKITISYDSGVYYITGALKVEGLADADTVNDEAGSEAAA